MYQRTNYLFTFLMSLRLPASMGISSTSAKSMTSGSGVLVTDVPLMKSCHIPKFHALAVTFEVVRLVLVVRQT